MTSCDTNVLFAALDSHSASHALARAFLESVGDSSQFCLCELVLVELYSLLRNPAACRNPCNAHEASRLVLGLRGNPRWSILDYPGPQSAIMSRLWTTVATPSFPYRRIYDLRLALTLRHHGIKQFATRNIRDFADAGFERVWDPLMEPSGRSSVHAK